MFFHWTGGIENAKVWTVVNSSFNNVLSVPTSGGLLYDFNAVAFGNNTFVAGGQSGMVYTSNDGITWVSRSTGVSDNITNIIYANGQFVGLLSRLTNNNIIFSTDGITWSVSTGISLIPEQIASNGSTYVVVDTNRNWYTSTDADTWSSSSPTGLSTLGTVGYMFYGALYVLLGSENTGGSPGAVWTSSDASTWTKRTLPVAANQLDTGAWTSGHYVIGSSLGGKPYYSTNGTTWSQATGITAAYENMSWTGQRFIAAQDADDLYQTIDYGDNWTLTDSSPQLSASFNDIAVGNSVVIAVGTQGVVATLSP